MYHNGTPVANKALSSVIQINPGVSVVVVV
jgi:hypothetical protein